MENPDYLILTPVHRGNVAIRCKHITTFFQHRVKANFDNVEFIVGVPLPDGFHRSYEIYRLAQPAFPVIVLQLALESGAEA